MVFGNISHVEFVILESNRHGQSTENTNTQEQVEKGGSAPGQASGRESTLPVQEIWGDLTCCRAAKPVCQNY